MNRPDNRSHDALRNVSFFPGIAPHSSGSVLVSFGQTRVICSCLVETGVPNWMKAQRVAGGWLTAEYAMLPYSTLDRKARDISRGKLDGRSSEIQRLIGRSLRAVIDLKKLDGKTVWIDCDVLQADGGTRTASITGACVAAAIAFNAMVARGELKASPLRKLVAAISAGIYKDTACLDLNYIEDRDARVDANIVMTEDLDFVETQASGEEGTFSEQEMNAMLGLAKKGISELAVLQKEAILAAEGEVDAGAVRGLAEFFNSRA